MSDTAHTDEKEASDGENGDGKRGGDDRGLQEEESETYTMFESLLPIRVK